MDRPRERVKLVRNRSDRSGGPSAIAAIALHTTESHPRPDRSDVDAVWNWFDNPDAQASSHVIVGDQGESTQCVPDREKAWTIGDFNSMTLNIEMIGFARSDREYWTNHDSQLRKVAEYCAYWSDRWNVPLRRGSLGKRDDRSAVLDRGIVTHHDATLAGFGTHTDPGEGFPIKHLVTLAREIRR